MILEAAQFFNIDTNHLKIIKDEKQTEHRNGEGLAFPVRQKMSGILIKRSYGRSTRPDLVYLPISKTKKIIKNN